MSDYWKNRLESINNSIYNDAEKLSKEIDRLYQGAINDIEYSINAFIVKHANENSQLDYAKLTSELLTPIDMVDYRNKINTMSPIYQEAIENGDEELAQLYMQQMTTFRGRQKITIWQSLIDELQMRRDKLAIEQTKKVEEHLVKAYMTNFEKTAYLLSVSTGVEQYFIAPNEGALKYIVRTSPSGVTLSKSIWKNHDALVEKLKTELTRGVIQGDDINTMAKNLRPFLSGKTPSGATATKKAQDFYTKRIVRTETAFVLESSSKDSYKQAKVKKVEILATLSERTCEVCGKHDGDVIEVDKVVVGKNAPPWHP